jgi:hypothetical protein
VAFSSGEPGQASCTDTINCVGLYAFGGGAVRRLSGAPAHCPSASACTTFDEDPSVASDGRVYYEFDLISGDLQCVLGGCIEWQSGGPGTYVRDLAGEDEPTAVAFPSRTTENVEDGVAEQASSPVFAADPQDPGSIAYQGVQVSHCIDGEQNCYPVDVESIGEPATGRVIGEAVGYSARLAWSADATLIADEVTGTSPPGIWVFSTQGAASTGSLVLAGSGSWPGEYGFTFADDGELVVEYQDNLYSLPAGCWAVQSAIGANGAATPNCTIAADATALTAGGTTAEPFRYPAWTSAAVAPYAIPSTPGAAGGPSTAPAPAVHAANQITALRLNAHKLRPGQPLILDLTLTSKAKVKVAVLRYVPASGHGKHRIKAHYKQLGVLTFSGRTGLNMLEIVKVHGHRLAAGEYQARVSAGGKTQLVTFRVRRRH